MDHPVYLAWGISPIDPLYGYRGPISTSGVESLRTGPFRSSRAVWRIEMGNGGWNWPTGDPYTTGLDYIYGTNNGGLIDQGDIYGNIQNVTVLGSYLTRQFRIGFLVEQDAQTSNQVTLSSTYTDKLGIPRPEIQYLMSDYTKTGFASARTAADEFMSRMGANQFTETDPNSGTYFEYNGQRYNFAGAGHLCGTHVMGTTSQNSVADKYHSSWDHNNLFLIGCGSMPSIGTENPSLTMTAMVLLTAEEILSDLN